MRFSFRSRPDAAFWCSAPRWGADTAHRAVPHPGCRSRNRCRSRFASGLLALTCTLALPGWGAEPEWKPLLGDDLSNWETLLNLPHPSDEVPGLPRNADGSYSEPLGLNRDPVGVFTLLREPDGPVVRVSGRIFGTLLTKESYSNYHLRAQFRWGERKWAPRLERGRDGGLFFHVPKAELEPRRSYPRALEFQVQEGNVGDLYAIGVQVEIRARLRDQAIPVYDPAGEFLKFGQGVVRRPNCAKLVNLERPHGEWNDLELLCIGGESIYLVNGRVVMRARHPRNPVGETWESMTGGRIGLQSEGSEVFFRRLEIRPLTAIPPQLLPGSGSAAVEDSPWEPVADKLTFADGPCVGPGGDFYFCDMRGTPPTIWRVDATSRREKAFVGAACSGLKFDPEGRLFACAFNDRQVLAIDLTNGTQRVVASDLRVNDLALGPNRRAYVTETGKKQVTLVNLETGEARAVDQGSLNAPNGIVLSADGSALFVSDHRGIHVWRFRVQADGTLADGRPFATMQVPPDLVAPVGGPVTARGDGMTLDAAGRLYVATAAGIQVFGPTGELLRILPKPTDKSVTSCAVAGPASEFLYVTANDRVFRARLGDAR